MIFKEIQPCLQLQPYIKCFYLYTAHSDKNFEDTVFPSGTMELIFNLGSGNWQTKKNDLFTVTPAIEFWGQVTQPMAVQSIGRNVMLGCRFYPHSAAYFFNDPVALFNNEVIDATELFGNPLQQLHSRLLNTVNLQEQVALIEEYLAARIAVCGKKHRKIQFIGDIINNLVKDYSDDNINTISSRHNISTRYLNTLFSQYTGLAPKLFYKINRFQYSLSLVQSNKEKLTSVAYSAGYFDQAHFIKEFRNFTGFTPNAFTKKASPINQLLAGS